MVDKSQKILTCQDEVLEFLGIGKTLYAHFMTMGMPIAIINGRHYAHADVLDAWFKLAFGKQVDLQIPENGSLL